MTDLKIYKDIKGEITWDNFKVEPGEESIHEDGYWDLCEVLYCKLDWIKEVRDLDDEHIDTIDLVQKLLGLLNEKKIEKIIKNEN